MEVFVFAIIPINYKKYKILSCLPHHTYTYRSVPRRVSAHGRLNITHDLGPHGRLPGIKIPYICIEAATVAP